MFCGDSPIDLKACPEIVSISQWDNVSSSNLGMLTRKSTNNEAEEYTGKHNLSSPLYYYYLLMYSDSKSGWVSGTHNIKCTFGEHGHCNWWMSSLKGSDSDHNVKGFGENDENDILASLSRQYAFEVHWFFSFTAKKNPHIGQTPYLVYIRIALL